MNAADSVSSLSKVQPYAAGSLPAYWHLTKPRLTLLAVATTLLGFYLGSWTSLDTALFSISLAGSALVGLGANALNQYLERETDAKMKRTQTRPLPSGRLNENQALTFGVFLSVTGILLLAFFVNLLTALLGVVTLVIYLFAYTPLKRKTPLCTLVGAIPGAIPPVMGWTAARGELGLEAWVLFAILFLWQLPHFLAIAWFCREDYARAGFPMLTVLDENGKRTAHQISLYSLALLPVSLVPGIIGMTGPVYFFAALVLGVAFSGFSLFLVLFNTDRYAKKFFLASVAYLFLLIVFMMSDKI